STYIYSLSLHDALPICLGTPLAVQLANVRPRNGGQPRRDHRKGLRLHEQVRTDRLEAAVQPVSEVRDPCRVLRPVSQAAHAPARSEEHTSELQSRSDLV